MFENMPLTCVYLILLILPREFFLLLLLDNYVLNQLPVCAYMRALTTLSQSHHSYLWVNSEMPRPSNHLGYRKLSRETASSDSQDELSPDLKGGGGWAPRTALWLEEKSVLIGGRPYRLAPDLRKNQEKGREENSGRWGCNLSSRWQKKKKKSQRSDGRTEGPVETMEEKYVKGAGCSSPHSQLALGVRWGRSCPPSELRPCTSCLSWKLTSHLNLSDLLVVLSSLYRNANGEVKNSVTREHFPLSLLIRDSCSVLFSHWICL